MYPTDIEYVWLIIADFTGDGHIDLATANVVLTVSILLGNGDGTFGSTVNYPTGIQPVFITSGYFNGDDNADLATIQDSDNSISILFVNGDGTFAPPGPPLPKESNGSWHDSGSFMGQFCTQHGTYQMRIA